MIILPSHGRVASVRGLDAGRLLVLVPHLLPRVAARQYASSDVAACRCCRTSSQARCPRNALP